MRLIKHFLLTLWWDIIIPIIVWLRLAIPQNRSHPNFVIIGVQKGGTTALFDYLTQHPEIGGSLKKEVHYYDLNSKKPLAWYRAHFPKAKRFFCVGESSPYYFFHPFVAKRMAKVAPKTKLIVLLREPVSRAYSHYQMMRRKGLEKRSFKQAVKEEPNMIKEALKELHNNPHKTNKKHRHYSYLSRGDYEQQLEQWLNYFPQEQLLVLQSEALQQEPEQVLPKVYNFLSVEEKMPKDIKPKHVGKYPNIDDSLAKELKERYKNQEEYLNKNFNIAWREH